MIFAAIAVAWLAYLVPHFVRRPDDAAELDDSDPADRFSDSMRIVRHGTAPLLDHDLEEIAAFEVSTPQTRRAAVNDLRRLEQLAASRRRRALLGLMALLSAVIGFCAVQLIPWWSTAIPSGLLLIFVLVARISVRAMRTKLAARSRDIRHGNNESTIFLSLKDFRQGRRRFTFVQRQGRRSCEAGPSVGSHPDHHADLCFQAARSSDRPYH